MNFVDFGGVKMCVMYVQRDTRGCLGDHGYVGFDGGFKSVPGFNPVAQFLDLMRR